MSHGRGGLSDGGRMSSLTVAPGRRSAAWCSPAWSRTAPGRRARAGAEARQRRRAREPTPRAAGAARPRRPTRARRRCSTPTPAAAPLPRAGERSRAAGCADRRARRRSRSTAPVSGDAALARLPPTRRAGSKPFAIEGLNDETGSGKRRSRASATARSRPACSWPTAPARSTRSNTPSSCMKVQAFADAINGAPEFPDMLDEVARARELDQFASAARCAARGSRCARATRPGAPATCSSTRARLGFVPGVVPGRHGAAGGRRGRAAGAGR